MVLTLLGGEAETVEPFEVAHLEKGDGEEFIFVALDARLPGRARRATAAATPPSPSSAW